MRPVKSTASASRILMRDIGRLNTGGRAGIAHSQTRIKKRISQRRARGVLDFSAVRSAVMVEIPPVAYSKTIAGAARPAVALPASCCQAFSAISL